MLLTGMALSQSRLMLNFSVFGIRWLGFPANMFPLSLKMSYDRGRLFSLTMKPFLSQRFCWSVRPRTVGFGAISGSLSFMFWVTVYFFVVVLWVNGIREGNLLKQQQPKGVPNTKRRESSLSTFIFQYPDEVSSFEKKQAPDVCENISSAVGSWRCSRFRALFEGRSKCVTFHLVSLQSQDRLPNHSFIWSVQ